MTPDSIILLDANARLTHLIDLMNEALAHAKAQGTEQAWDMHVVAWERLMAELMAQVDQPISQDAPGLFIQHQEQQQIMISEPMDPLSFSNDDPI